MDLKYYQIYLQYIRATLSPSLSTQLFHPQKQVHYLKREFTIKGKICIRIMWIPFLSDN